MAIVVPRGDSILAEVPRLLPLAAVAGAVVLLDQLSKSYVTGYLQALADRTGTTISQAQVKILGGKVAVDYVTNTGAAFGVLPNQTVLFSLIAASIILAIVLSYRRLAQGPASVRFGLGLVLGGAVGNLIDRIRLGHVVDFIDLRWWPVFNAADSCIVIGVATIIITMLVQSERAGTPPPRDI